jgi:hypothetical protein
MSETAENTQPIESTEVPTTITDEDQDSSESLGDLMQSMVIVAGTLSFEEVPKVKYMTRPAPTPDGKIAVMLKSFRNGYFLVDKNPSCKGCGGDGLDKRKDASTKLSEIPYCPACVISEIQHFGQIWEGKLAEKSAVIDAEERAERTDKKLEKRLTDARERVAELEKAKTDALGQNVLDTTATKAAIEALKEEVTRFDEYRKEYARRLSDAVKTFNGEQQEAQAVYDEKTKVAREELEMELARIKRERTNYVAQHSECVAKIDIDAVKNTQEQAKAIEALARYEAGPAKIAKRWDEKLEPARKTLERLERQWKS